MKTITIGKKKYELAENAEDLSVKRFRDLKQYMIYRETGLDAPSLMKMLREFIDGFDNDRRSQMLLSMHNYLTGLATIEQDKDANQLMFALITFDENEDPTQFDETKAKAKIEEMNKNGLKQGFVEETVVNFITASSAHFLSYFRESSTRPTVEP